MREQRLLFSSVNLIKVLKVTIGAFLAILIANLLGISYSTSAGVITILSIQNTKRETLLLVGKRIGAFFIALIIAFLIFHLFGYQVLAIGCFLLLFSSFCYLCSLQDGLVMNTVLMFHFYILLILVPFSFLLPRLFLFFHFLTVPFHLLVLMLEYVHLLYLNWFLV